MTGIVEGWLDRLMKAAGLRNITERVPYVFGEGNYDHNDAGWLWRARAATFVGKTIASSELVGSYESSPYPEYWALTFTDGTRVLVGLWGGSLIGTNRARVAEYIGGYWKKELSAFLSSDEVERLEGIKEKLREEQEVRTRSYIVENMIRGADNYQLEKGTRLEARIILPDGQLGAEMVKEVER